MKEILEKYKNYLTARKSSMNYYNIIRIFLAYLQERNIEIANITQETITEFFNSNSNYSSNTRNQFIKAGRHFYSFMNIDISEWKKIKLIKVDWKIPKYISEKELEEGKKYIKTYHSKKYSIPKIEALLNFMYYSGCRKTEILTLKRADFNLEENVAKVWGKGNKERVVCYPTKVKKELEIYFSSEAEENNAFNITIGKIHYIMKLLEKYLGRKIYSHLFRHSFARNLVHNKGVDLTTVSKLLGHSSLNTTMIYVTPDEKTIKENYKKWVG